MRGASSVLLPSREKYLHRGDRTRDADSIDSRDRTITGGDHDKRNRCAPMPTFHWIGSRVAPSVAGAKLAFRSDALDGAVLERVLRSAGFA
jgi:hypothetical protein